MLKDCLEIFDAELKRTQKRFGDADQLILAEYIPADGDYLVVAQDGNIRHCSVRLDKQTRQAVWSTGDEDLKESICFYDYHSRLVSMDKPQDPKKVIHSNNYLSFWIKWDSLGNGKLNAEAVDRYFDILKNPREKYKKPQDRKMYDYIAEQVGDIAQDTLESNRRWIQEHIFLLDTLGIDFVGKNYLKIFFDAEKELYIGEEKRYLMTKIFNKNDYNLDIDHQMLGLPNDNLGLNAKKPYMENKTRKVTVPYLITPEEAVRQRMFFDYLMNKANKGETDIFFDNDEDEKTIIAKKKGQMPEGEFSGYFLRIQKGKELEIHHQDTIVDYKYFLTRPFIYRNTLQCEDKEERYKEYTSRQGIQDVINEVIFNKWLISNYFTAEDQISVDGELKHNIIWSREAIFAWLYKGRLDGMAQILHKLCMNMIKVSFSNEYMLKVKQQFNLMCSFDEYFGGCNMEENYIDIRNKLRMKINEPGEFVIESDAEYFFAIGQMVYYFITLSKAKDKTHSLANPFFNAAANEVLRKKLQQYFMKYNHELKQNGYRFNRLYKLIINYKLKGNVSQEDIIAGYFNDNLILESKKKDKEEA